MSTRAVTTASTPGTAAPGVKRQRAPRTMPPLRSRQAVAAPAHRYLCRSAILLAAVRALLWATSGRERPVGPTTWSSPDPRTGACRDLANDRAQARAGGKRWEAFAAGENRYSRMPSTAECCFARRAIATALLRLQAPHALQAVVLARGRPTAARRRVERGSLRRPRRDFSSWGAAGARHRGRRVPLSHGRSHDLEARDSAVGDCRRTARATPAAVRRGVALTPERSPRHSSATIPASYASD
jgi:hypothetical protein